MPTRARFLTDWTVDYGKGPKPVLVPHAWRQEVDVRWEGPAVYETTVEVPEGNWWLVFHGVSYAAKVFLDGELAREHHGIWDAFSVALTTSPLEGEVGERSEPGEGDAVKAPTGTSTPLPPPPLASLQGEGELTTSPLEGEVGERSEPGEGESLALRESRIAIRVEVTKNGGPTYPVRDVASGFLPFVFNTFGGIYKEVELLESEEDPMLGIWGLEPFGGSRTERPRTGVRTERPRSDEPPSQTTPFSASTPPQQPTDPSSASPHIPSSSGAPTHPPADSPTHPLTGSPSHPLTDSPSPPLIPKCRVTVKGTKIFVDGKPFYLRAPLTWGWYPEFGHTNPDEETVRKEVRQMKSMGFNTVKFCLWVPHHRYFEILEEEGMFAWLELPLWDPTPNTEHLNTIFEELRRIVLEYRRHSNIIVWTCGCELSSNTSAEYRERLYKMVKELTGAALVKDNSGGSEMYGGDLREFGDFYDFHPYCDLPFYPLVLDSLMVGPRKKMPILLGEFNDIDVHRDLARLKRERPFWASSDPYLNDQGSRWDKPELPRILEESRWALIDVNGSAQPRLASSIKGEVIRHRVFEHVRSHSDIAGWVVTGWRDTPIASSGVVDDWGETLIAGSWGYLNRDSVIFPIAFRRPPWIDGGNRPGWIDPWNYFEGPVSIQFGYQGPRAQTDRLLWSLHRHDPLSLKLVDEQRDGEVLLKGIDSEEGGFLGTLDLGPLEAGTYTLAVKWGTITWADGFSVFAKPGFEENGNWLKSDAVGSLDKVALSGHPNVIATDLSGEWVDGFRKGSSAIVLLTDLGTKRAPFWRECTQQWRFPDNHPVFPYRWWNLLSVSPDRVIDLDALQEAVGKLDDLEVLINRIDTRTYREDPILIRAKVGRGTLVATTLRPYGGLGIQPVGVMNNPAGAALLESLILLAEEKW